MKDPNNYPKIYYNFFQELRRKQQVRNEIAEHKEAIRVLKYKLKGQKDPYDILL